MSARVVMIAMLLAGCASRLEDLEPYPCPSEGGHCPDGRACVRDTGCVTPFTDGPCNDFTDCTAAGADHMCLGGACALSGNEERCEVGVCLPICGAGLPCSTSRVCTQQSGSGTGVCLEDCTIDGICPSGLACRSLLAIGRYGCIPPEVNLPQCAGIQIVGTCQSCGDPSRFDVACPGSSAVCPHSSTCESGTDVCTCAPGLAAFSCSGLPCTVELCEFPNWECRAATGFDPGCEDSLFQVSGFCSCIDGRTIPFDCGESRSCNQLCG